MPASTDIYSLAGRGVQQPQDPMNMLAKTLQIQQMQQQGEDRALQMQQQSEDRALKMQEYQRGKERENRLMQLLGGEYADDETRASALMRGGFLKESQDYLKGRADVKKTGVEMDAKRFEIASKKLDIAGQAMGFVKDNPSVESAKAAIQNLVSNGIWDQTQAEQAMARVMADPSPESIRTLATVAYQSALSAKDQLPSFVQQNRGGTVATQRINPITGAVADVQSANVTESEAQRLARERAAADAAAGRAVQIRGQNLSDARAREGTWSLNADGVLTNSRSGETKAATGAGGKPVGSPKLNELQGKATGFASRMRDAEKTLGQLEDKVAPSQVAIAGYKSEFPNWLPGGQILGAGITAANRTLNPYVTEEAMKYQQAQENWVTANLRLESGAVIGPEEMQKEIQKYFPQPGDPKSLRDQKKAARAVAQRAVTAQAGPGQNMIEGIAGGQPSGGASGAWDNADPLGLRR